MIKDNGSFCVLPFCTLSANNDGAIRICCNNRTLPRDSKGEVLSLNSELPLNDLYNNDFHKEVRRSMLEGTPHPSCYRCLNAETNGGSSFRQDWNDVYKKEIPDLLSRTRPDGAMTETKFLYFDITFGNNCNIRCRMCNPSNSKLTIPESLALDLHEKTYINGIREMDWYKKENFFRIFREAIPTIDRVNFLGGEPLFVKEHYEILKQLIDSGRAASVEIQYVSNLTVVSPELFELWSKFKVVNLGVSIDGFEGVNDYIRFPSTWETLQKNIRFVGEAYKTPNIQLTVHSTFQIYNILNLPKLLRHIKEDLGPLGFFPVPYLSYVNYPAYFDPNCLPQKFKLKVRQILSLAINELADDLPPMAVARLNVLHSHVETMMEETSDGPERWQKFLRVTRDLDRSRGQNILTAIPELAAFF